MKFDTVDSDALFGDVISSYTRAHAIADGVLIDVTKEAAKMKFKCPVAVTTAVWDKYIEWTDEDDDNQIEQTTQERLWDVLHYLHFNIQNNKPTDYLIYDFLVITRDGRATEARGVKLKSIMGLGDNLEPVITIMFPHED